MFYITALFSDYKGNDSKGILNNNWLNIRFDRRNNWKGLSKLPSNDGFCRFDDYKYGIRAALKILMNYQAKGLTTVKEIIRRWAPSSENPTQAYVSYVESQVFDEYSLIKRVLDRLYPNNDGSSELPFLTGLICAMIQFELGLHLTREGIVYVATIVNVYYYEA